MKFLESLLLTIFGYKAAKEVSKTVDTSSRGSSHYGNLRKKYYGLDELPQSLLTELQYREPDLFDSESGSDHRLFHNIKMRQFKIGETLYTSEAWFTISPKNRFIAVGNLDDIMYDNLREEKVDDFSSKPFSPSANPINHSITIEKYTFFFDHPFYYNLTLLLLVDSDKRYFEGERVQQRAVSYPKISIDDDIISRYGISLEEISNDTLTFENAYCAALNDFNSEKCYHVHKGRIELRKSPNHITIYPKGAKDNDYEINLSLSFLFSSESVNIRGDGRLKELYVCRTNDGWGGIKFIVASEKDYYRLSCWLIVAVADYCKTIKNWDPDEIIEEYWPSYPPLIEKKRDFRLIEMEHDHKIDKMVIFNDQERKLKLDLAHNIIVSQISTIHHQVDLPCEKDFNFYMPVFIQFREATFGTDVDVCIEEFKKVGIDHDKEDLEIFTNTGLMFYELFSLIVESGNLEDKKKDEAIEGLMAQADIQSSIPSAEAKTNFSSTVFLKQYLTKVRSADYGEFRASALLELIRFTCEKVILQLQNTYPDNFTNDTAYRAIDNWLLAVQE